MFELLASMVGVTVARNRRQTIAEKEGKTLGVDAVRNLVLEAKQGSDAARDELARFLRDPSYYFALQLLGNRDDAMDVAQDSLIRFFGSLDRFDENRPLLPWIRRIVRNAVVDLQRRKTVRRAGSIDSDGFEGEALEILDEDADSSERAVDLERRRIVWRSVEGLSAQQREIVVMREYQDLSYQEIADLLEIPIGTVMSRLHRARLELRSLVLANVAESELEGLL